MVRVEYLRNEFLERNFLFLGLFTFRIEIEKGKNLLVNIRIHLDDKEVYLKSKSLNVGKCLNANNKFYSKLCMKINEVNVQNL